MKFDKMQIIKSNSLAVTLDALNDIFFSNKFLSKGQKEKIAKWIVGRHGKPGSYANMFAPTIKDFRDGIRIFTGEKVYSRAAISHILGEESCRALIQLKVSKITVRTVLQRASEGILERLRQAERAPHIPGMYCCGTCTCSLWRHLVVGGLKSAERRLRAGMKALKRHRDGTGRWRRFPFYYTLLVLSEIDLMSAKKEMQYASKIIECFLRRSPKNDTIDERRRLLAERILAVCQ